MKSENTIEKIYRENPSQTNVLDLQHSTTNEPPRLTFLSDAAHLHRITRGD